MAEMKDLSKWADEHQIKPFDLWREAMVQLRQLHGDVWNGVRFFLTVNGIIIAAIFAILARYLTSDTCRTGILVGVVIILSSVGVFLSIIAIKILKKHRDYYLNILLLKTLLEKTLGFSKMDFQGIDLSFPWKVEKKYVDKALENPKEWITKHRWHPGTISRLLWITYWFFMALYVLIIIVVIECTLIWCVYKVLV
jgi:hypothetical protein